MKSVKKVERVGLTKQMNDGYICTITVYNNVHDITIKYEDGKEIEHCHFSNFKKGTIRKYSAKEIGEQRIGEKNMMSCGMECSIIAYRGAHDIDVQFEDGNIVNHRAYHSFLSGKILNDKFSHNWSQIEDLTGKKFNRWTVLYFDKENRKSNMLHWICKCDCGTIKSVCGRDLRNGKSKSCGCLKNEINRKRCSENVKTKKLKEEYPELIKYLVNEEDGELTLGQRSHEIECICPLCKERKTYKSTRDFYKYGFVCQNCSSKISYPNRFIYKFLTQLGIEFETEKMFDWLGKKRYDFFIPSLSCVIEAHGQQHYTNSLWSTVEEQHKNDMLKENLALSNGITNYIQLDCRKSSMKYIKQSILNNEKMGELFDLTKIDWNKIDKELREV